MRRLKSNHWLLFMGALLFVLTGCTAPEGTSFWFRMTAPESTVANTYFDSEFNMQISFTRIIGSQMEFNIVNQSREPIKLIWDNCVFVDFDGQPSRIIHWGIKYIDKEKSMAPTVIPPNTTLREGMTPTNRINWLLNSWVVTPLVRSPRNLEGIPFSFYMCFEQLGQQKNINFTFMIMSNKTPDNYNNTKTTASPISLTFTLPNSTKKDGAFGPQTSLIP